jgi:2-methylisocitrate lyase-like PEP mutase family enzyme
MSSQRQLAAGQTFTTLHAERPGFIMPNAWDAGSAAVLAAAGFKAIATTSAGIAFSLGKQDYGISHPSLSVSREEMFDRVRQIVDTVPIPVSGDLEAGYGDRPEDVAETIAMAIDAGLAGANIEDKKPQENSLYDEALAIERIAAAREVIAKRGVPFILTARTDVFLQPGGKPADAIRRANLFRSAGADCLYAPGPSDLATSQLLVREIDGPINVVIGLGSAKANARELLASGVQRISLGGSIARSALGFVRRCAQELIDEGTIRFAETQIGQSELNALFARSRATTD